MRNKNDYFREVDDLRASADLRSRIAALEVKKDRGTARRVARRLAVAACLALAVAAAGLLLFNRTGGELRPGPTPTPTPAQEQPPIPDEELAQLLANAYAASQDGAIQEGDQWQLLASHSENGRTMGILRYESAVHAGGYGNLALGVFDSAGRLLVGELHVLRGDAGDFYSWTDDGDGQFYTVCTNYSQGQGWQACSAALFVLQDSGLVPVRALPDEDAPLFDLGAQGYDDFWTDRKGIIRIQGSLVGLDLYTRDSDPRRQQSGDDAWNLERYLPLGTARVTAAEPDASEAFYSYSGPVLPLTATSIEGGPCTAVRTVTFDFTDLLHPHLVKDNFSLPPCPRVTDRYTITNNADHDQHLALYYPWSNCLLLSERGFIPTLTVSGGEVTDSGTVLGATVVLAGAPENGYGSLPDFGAYEFLLSGSGESYLSRSLQRPDLIIRDLPAAMYDVTDIHGADSAADPWAATLAVEFTLSDPEAQIFTYGFDGQTALDRENGVWRYSFFCNGNAAGLHRLLVIGGKLQNVTVTGYQDGTCTEVIPGFTATLTDGGETYFWAEGIADVLDDYYWDRSECPLYSLDYLSRAAADLIWNAARTPAMLNAGWDISSPGFNLYPRVAPELFPDGWYRLEDIFSKAAVQERIFYAVQDVTVPAGESVTVEAAFYYYPGTSINYMDPDRTGVFFGYDLAMTLGSALDFTYANLDIRLPDGYTLLNGNREPDSNDLPFTQERCYFAVAPNFKPGPVYPQPTASTISTDSGYGP